jgi:uncharacterized protein (DUF169 family)
MTEGINVQQALGLRVPPIAIGFFEEPPAGVSQRSSEAVPAGCAFWKEAQEGKSFYTLQPDHYNCTVGSYTHSIELPAERAQELESTLSFMVENEYLAMEEVPNIPRLPKAPKAVAYGPADAPGFDPDIVLISARPDQAMLIYEACLKAGAGNPMTNLVGRPSCAVLPLALNTDASSMSLGCRGNRLYAGLQENELYVAIPGDKWAGVQEEMERILKADSAMTGYYNQHARDIAAG